MASKSTASSPRYTLENPESLLKLADELKSFVDQNHLATTIDLGKRKGKHINVEAWQYLGAQLGIVSLAEETENLSDERQVKYATRVVLIRLSDGAKVGQGYALCSNVENRWKNKPEYSIASMSATRAIGKAYRNNFAWIVKAAGYETTPVEELDDPDVSKDIDQAVTPAPAVPQHVPTPPIPAPPATPAPKSEAAPLATAKQKKLLKELLDEPIFVGDERADRLKQSLRDDLLSKPDASTFLDRLMDDRETGQIGVMTMRRDLNKAAGQMLPEGSQQEYLQQVAQVWNLEQYENLYHQIKKASEEVAVA